MGYQLPGLVWRARAGSVQPEADARSTARWDGDKPTGTQSLLMIARTANEKVDPRENAGCDWRLVLVPGMEAAASRTALDQGAGCIMAVCICICMTPAYFRNRTARPIRSDQEARNKRQWQLASVTHLESGVYLVDAGGRGRVGVAVNFAIVG
jgi:hypothetical protein